MKNKHLFLSAFIISFTPNLWAKKTKSSNPGSFNAQFGQAKLLFDRNNFVEAAKGFYSNLTIVTGDKREKAEFAVAESLRRLGLDYASTYFYSRIVLQGPKHSLFRQAMENLARINGKIPLGKASIISLLQEKSITPISIPPSARGFYFFYRGLDAFESNRIPNAKAEFERVPSDTSYYSRAQYYLGTINTLQADLDGSIVAFNKVLKKSDNGEGVHDLANMGMGRVFFEKKDYARSIQAYSRIPRDSDLWLDSLFEGGYAFFHLQKHNNTLGNVYTIHTPFFYNRFYPESYILNAITYVRLCRYSSVQQQLKNFQTRYKPTFADLKKLLVRYKGQYQSYFNFGLNYRKTGKTTEFQSAMEVVDNATRTDAFKEAITVIKNINRESDKIEKFSNKWSSVGLSDVLTKFFNTKKNITMTKAGQDMYFHSVDNYNYLLRLSNETRLINLEMLSGNTDKLRSEYTAEEVKSGDTQWGEGMRPLNLNQSIEYWPHDGEFWENELGAYVFNVSSECKAAKKE